MSGADEQGLGPGRPCRGVLRPPASKSLGQRALLLGALAEGTTVLRGLGPRAEWGEDLAAAAGVAEGLGGTLRERDDGTLEVEGRSAAIKAEREWRWSVGESATLGRLSLAVAALAGGAGRRFHIEARGTLLQRRSTALVATLRRAAVELQEGPTGTWPVAGHSASPPEVLELIDPGSSQELSGLWLASAAGPRGFELRVRGAVPSQPYLRLTADLLRRFGAQASAATVDELRSTHWRGPLRAPREPLELEPDASAAAVALAAGCLSGGEVEVPGLGRHSLQGDVRMVEYLSAFGCEAVAEDARLWARGFPMRAVDLDLLGEPDLAPVLAAVAAALALRDPRSGRTRLRGLQTLAGKESDRLRALAEALAQLGLAVERGAAELSIAPPSGAPPSGEWILDSRGDHRLAFAFALLGLVREGVRVRGAGAVAKSWPTFWRDLRSLSAPDAPRG